LIYDYDWKEAGTQLEQALELNPNDSQTLLSSAHFLVAKGQFQNAIDAAERAARINPTDFIIHAWGGFISLRATFQQRSNSERKPNFCIGLSPAYMILGWAYEAAGRYDVARQYEISLEKEYSPAALASLGHLQAKLGDRRSALATLKELNQLRKRGSISYVSSYCRALVFAGLGEVDECPRRP
jgi:tetratricopeptide (TPR) repeat protein